MMRPDLDQSRYEQVINVNQGVKKNSIYDDHLLGGAQNTSTIQDHSIFVDMPNGISAKNSARTNQNFYKNSANKNQVRGGGFNAASVEESPQRITGSNDTLPNLTVKVIYFPNPCSRESLKSDPIMIIHQSAL